MIASILRDADGRAPGAVLGPGEIGELQVRPSGDGHPVVIEQFSLGRLASYKVPKRWVITDSLPMTASGRVQKHLLRELVSTAEPGGVR